MKYDLTQKLYALSGRPLRTKFNYAKVNEETGEEEDVIGFYDNTLGTCIRDCMLYQLDPSGVCGEEETLKRYDIYKRVDGVDGVELNQDEVDFIKDLVCKRYAPIQSGQLLIMLNKK